MTDRVVLANSRGLDTSVGIGRIAEETGAEVVAVAVDVGQGGEDLEEIRPGSRLRVDVGEGDPVSQRLREAPTERSEGVRCERSGHGASRLRPTSIGEAAA